MNPWISGGMDEINRKREIPVKRKHKKTTQSRPFNFCVCPEINPHVFEEPLTDLVVQEPSELIRNHSILG